ncbi:hypothetical protein BDV93DRAFT_519516 [Ceratobasidium sp. AG-I]|nr:hypothetical protein BDV93DRAFT_519516 [Ceratobasidium sp. AG-I]
MRVDLHTSFHVLLREFRETAVALPDMTIVLETFNLDWLKQLAAPLRARLELLSRCLLSRVCFMERMQGEDLTFGTKNLVKDLKDGRTRLRGHLNTIEQRILTLTLCAHKDQLPVAGLTAQQFGRVDKSNQRCVHNSEDPLSGSRRPDFPVARRYHKWLAASGRSVVGAYIEIDRMSLRRQLLAKLGVQICEPSANDYAQHYILTAHWNCILDHERAHIAAAYFRRIIFSDSHLFIPAHFHTFSFQQQILALPKIFNSDGEELELSEDIDASLLCMISFILSPDLCLSHLEILRDFSIWPAHLEIRTAVQDVTLDIESFDKRHGKPTQPFWADPISRDVFRIQLGNNSDGAYPLLCGSLHEASYLQATQDEGLDARFWPHIASLIHGGKCLFTTVRSSSEWCDLVRTLAVYRVPLHARIFPQIVGTPVGDLWASDRVSNAIRGESGRDDKGETPDKVVVDEQNQARTASRVGRYRLDEALELAGVTMLGIIEGGHCDVRGLEGTRAAKFMQNLRHLPQIWFTLPTYDPSMKDMIIELLKRAQLPDVPFTVRIDTDEPKLFDALTARIPPYHNALQRKPGTKAHWASTALSLSQLWVTGRLKYEPVPKRIEEECCIIQMACRDFISGGVHRLLEELLSVCIVANGVRSKPTLEDEMEKVLEQKFNMVTRDHQGRFTYQFDPARIMPIIAEPGNLTLGSEAPSSDTGLVVHRLVGSPQVPHESRHAGFLPPATQDRSPLSISYALPPASTPSTVIPSILGLKNARARADQSESGINHNTCPHDRCDEGKKPTSGPDATKQNGSTYGSKNIPVAGPTEWFDLMLMGEAGDLPDLSEWGVTLPR